jgi:hypothetical protein
MSVLEQSGLRVGRIGNPHRQSSIISFKPQNSRARLMADAAGDIVSAPQK